MSSEGTPAGGDAAAAAAAAAAAGNKPWFDGGDADIVGHIQNRGLATGDAKSAAFNLAKAHREAEKLLGAPANELFRTPKDANDVEGWTRFDDRFGVPKEAKEYDFSMVKRADGTTLDPSLIEALAPALRAAHVSKAAAPDVVKALLSTLDKNGSEAAANKAAALASEREALRISWGSNVEGNLLMAKNAAAAVGATPEAVAALEQVMGYGPAMQMFRNIATKIGEDAFISSQAPGSNGAAMTVEQAGATLAEKMNDQAWVAKLNAGDTTALREFNNLTTLKAAGQRR